jgi:hypothetical protein
MCPSDMPYLRWKEHVQKQLYPEAPFSNSCMAQLLENLDSTERSLDCRKQKQKPWNDPGSCHRVPLHEQDQPLV